MGIIQNTPDNFLDPFFAAFIEKFGIVAWERLLGFAAKLLGLG
jgi:hypothetical protein